MRFRFLSPFLEFSQDLIGLAIGLRGEFLAEFPVATEEIVDDLLAAPVHISDEDPEIAGLRFVVIEGRHHALEPLLMTLEGLLMKLKRLLMALKRLLMALKRLLMALDSLFMSLECLLMAVEGGHQALEGQGVTLGSDAAESQLFLAALGYLRQFPSPHAAILTKMPVPVTRQMDQFRNPLASS
jgi:hypothetical protein